MMRIFQGLVIALAVGVALPACAAADLVSTIKDQESVEVTVYNSNLGLVKDTRKIKLNKGDGQMQFMDVAAFIQPYTVAIRSLDAAEDFSILEQNYEYDLMNSTKLLDKYVGKKLKLVTRNQYQDKTETVEAELLSNNQGQIYRIGNEIHIGYPGEIILPSLPEDLIAKPTLTWMYQNNFSGAQNIEVSYLTQNISWKADYIVVIDKNDAKADVSGWVTLDNKSGATYRNAKLKLVAGEVNRVNDVNDYTRGNAKAMRAVAESKAGFQEQSFFEYHLYDLQQPTTIKDLQTKQVRLLEANQAGVTKIFKVQGQNNYWYGPYNQTGKVPVQVMLQFQNSKDNHMGFALPAGTMRLYKADAQGSLQFIGEDAIKHTPKDEKVDLKIGEAFDVVAERVQMDYQNINRGHESEWEVTIRNHKEEAIDVQVLESIPGDWTVMSQSQKFTKVDAFTARFDVNVPKDGEAKVRYRVRIKY
ncbi:MAG: DUF4139 domain-containing protein [Candidatus Omnitrophica bacterium]|nr:DUF4139 domain-containing protein [Candidatus Omnitrophota bacterium]